MDQIWILKLESMEYQNIMSVQMVMNFFDDGLKDYKESTFKHLHQKLQGTLQHVRQMCPGNCSKNIGDLRNWCHTCSTWRTGILGNHRNRGHVARAFDWTRIDSSKWPTDFKEVMKVFYPKWWKPLFNDEDISVTLNAMSNYVEFKDVSAISNLREIRNKSHHEVSLTNKLKQSYCIKIIHFL